MYSYEQVDKAEADRLYLDLEFRADALLKKARDLSAEFEDMGTELLKIEAELKAVLQDLRATEQELRSLRTRS